jgi:hypothetical protein
MPRNDETNRVGLASAGMPQMGAGVVAGEHQHGAWTRQCNREAEAMNRKRSNGLSHEGGQLQKGCKRFAIASPVDPSSNVRAGHFLHGRFAASLRLRLPPKGQGLEKDPPGRV